VASADELFPKSPRCVFQSAPLVQVICQLRFPPILAIEATVPADFQGRIRSMFPLLERGTAITLPQVPPELLQLFGAATGARPYLFLTEDRSTTLNLATDAISLTTTNYPRWPEFRRLLQEPLRALADIYQPSFFTRIGLRYSNAIMRRKLHMEDTPWSALLRREILGELAIPQFEKNVDVANRTLQLKLPNGEGGVVLRHGLGIVTGAPQPPEPSYMIDLDFFRDEKTELRDAEPLLDKFHELAGHAFRWVISDRLRAALGPTEPDGNR
jgi:uncharacterized protein (TIGR04255 family)